MQRLECEPDRAMTPNEVADCQHLGNGASNASCVPADEEAWFGYMPQHILRHVSTFTELLSHVQYVRPACSKRPLLHACHYHSRAQRACCKTCSTRDSTLWCCCYTQQDGMIANRSQHLTGISLCVVKLIDDKLFPGTSHQPVQLCGKVPAHGQKTKDPGSGVLDDGTRTARFWHRTAQRRTLGGISCQHRSWRSQLRDAHQAVQTGYPEWLAG